MLRHKQDSWANPKVLVIFAVIFLCGVAVGSAVTRAYLHQKFAPATSHQGMEAARDMGLQRLTAELGLTSDQKKILMKELDDYAKYYQNIEDERDDVAANGKRRILAVLTPEQKIKFNAIYGPGPQ